MKQKTLTKCLPVLAIVVTGIFSIIFSTSCSQGIIKEDDSNKTLIMWSVDPLSEIPPDSISYDGRWGFSVIACQGEYESGQIAIRTEDKKLIVHASATDLLQTLGPAQFDLKNLELQKIEYLSDGIRETPVPLPGSFVLEPNHTQVLRLTVYVPKGTEPTGYHLGVIKLSMDDEEVEIGMLIRVKDIEMPESDDFNLKKLAGSYGLESLAGILTQEPGEGESDNSVYREQLRDGVEDLQLLWLLEQEQIELARQQGIDITTIDPTAVGREICSVISNKLTGTNENISVLREVRNDIISAIERAKILPADIGNTITVKATVAPTTPADYAYGTEDRFSFHFQLQWTPVGKVKAGDYLRFTFRNIFTNELRYYKYPVKAPHSAETKVILTSEDVNLKASSYHVRVDLMRGDQSLSPRAPGACQIYVTREGESAGHQFASFVVSRLAYMWDDKQGIYYHMLPGNLSPSGDPFDPSARSVYERALRLNINSMGYYDWTGRHPMEHIVPEGQHDGGAGILRTAGIFRQLGEMDRALFCEQAVQRIVSAVLARKVATNENGQPGLTFYGPRQQHTILLKLICDAAIYFRDVADDKEYAEKLYEPIKLLGDYQMTQPNAPLGISEGKVYDGRIMVGISNYCLAENALFGEFNREHVETVLDLARRMSEHTLLHHGWYDDGGLKSHDGYGTMNVLWGLLEARKVALATEEDDLAELFGKAIFTAFDFLARTNSTTTGYIPQWIPSRHGAWSAGDTYEMMNEMERQFGEDENVQWFRSHISFRNITYSRILTSRYNETSSLGSKNTLPVYLTECEEYKKAVE
ncbi:MAG: hypothetical protein U9R60_10435 [Bacteroidota bacterium]|nr:hypothetical protein [Bacteroidota bacterium]